MAAVQLNLVAARPVAIVEAPRLRDEIISSIARKTVCELLVSMTFTSMTCFFVAAPSGVVVLVAATVCVVAINLLIRGAAGYATLRLHALERDNSPRAEERREAYRKFIRFANYLCPLNFSQIDTTTRATLIHEGGHALAAMALYGDLPEITLMPFEGGMTEFSTEQLTSLGRRLGEENSAFITAAAGSGAVLLFALIQIILGHTLSENHPELSRYLNVTALTSLLGEIAYAAHGVLRDIDDGHDSYFLRTMAGVHPATYIATLVLLPLLAKALLYALDCRGRRDLIR